MLVNVVLVEKVTIEINSSNTITDSRPGVIKLEEYCFGFSHKNLTTNSLTHSNWTLTCNSFWHENIPISPVSLGYITVNNYFTTPEYKSVNFAKESENSCHTTGNYKQSQMQKPSTMIYRKLMQNTTRSTQE